MNNETFTSDLNTLIAIAKAHKCLLGVLTFENANPLFLIKAITQKAFNNNNRFSIVAIQEARPTSQAYLPNAGHEKLFFSTDEYNCYTRLKGNISIFSIYDYITAADNSKDSLQLMYESLVYLIGIKAKYVEINKELAQIKIVNAPDVSVSNQITKERKLVKGDLGVLRVLPNEIVEITLEI